MPQASRRNCRQERKDTEQSKDQVSWEQEDDLTIGERLDLEFWDNELEGHWIFPQLPVTKKERSWLYGKVLEVVITPMLKNPVYTNWNSLFKQVKGGVIGLRLMEVVAMIVMNRWARSFILMLRQAEITIHLLKKYVDDINLAVGLPEKGSGWARQYYDCKLYPITDYNSNSYYYDLYYYKLYLKHNKVTVRHKTILAVAYNLWTIILIQVSSKTIKIT